MGGVHCREAENPGKINQHSLRSGGKLKRSKLEVRSDQRFGKNYPDFLPTHVTLN